MRVVTVVGVLLAAGAGGAATLSAQHAHQLEIGGFGRYTRYDKPFPPDNQVGGGGRLGVFFNETPGLEGDGNIAAPVPEAGGPRSPMRSRRRSAIPSSRRAARSPPRHPPSRRVRGAAHASRSGPATGPTNGIGAHKAASLSSRPTTTATPLSRRSAGIG